jgi:hypothetical protein
MAERIGNGRKVRRGSIKYRLPNEHMDRMVRVCYVMTDASVFPYNAFRGPRGKTASGGIPADSDQLRFQLRVEEGKVSWMNLSLGSQTAPV